MTISPSDLRLTLLKRGVALNDAITSDSLSELEAAIGPVRNSYFLAVVREFDGFKNDDFDTETFLSVWSSEKIIRNLSTSSLPAIQFADSDFCAKVFHFDPSKNDRFPVRDSEDHLVSISYSNFWANFLDGSLAI